MKEAAPKDEWFENLKKPHIQAGFGIGVIVIFILGGAMMSGAGSEMSERWGYQAAATGMLLFGMGNALMSLSADNINRYWGTSFICYAGVAGIGIMLAWLQTGHWITDPGAGSYKSIFIVLTIGYLVILSIVSAMKNIVNFAEREEWNEPRQRD
ncbi:MAG: hypothetical protein AB8F78_02620 [Saprospiraceae bacterium]